MLDAWAATAAEGRGLFRTPSSAGPGAAPHDGIVPREDVSVVAGITSHHIWLLFWIETWQVRSDIWGNPKCTLKFNPSLA